MIEIPEIETKENIGLRMYDLISSLFPICRSITGNGVRETLNTVKEFIPITIHEVASGTPVFDWTVPKEWNIKDAYMKDPNGKKIIDFKNSNLHVLNYSIPIHKTISLEDLKSHLFSIPENPDWIPYRTSYYKENWGFCLSHNQLLSLKEGQYEIMIDSTLEDGHLTYGEYFLPGEMVDEVLISCHICHPSLANDNLAGLSVAVFLADYLARQKTRYSYRFLFIPGTIGSITWLSQNKEKTSNIKYGLVATLLGDSGSFTYKKSRRGDAEIDRIVSKVLKESDREHKIIDFFPYGYDERQYCSPGFNLPVGCLMRTPHGQYKEYHTSADNLDLVKPERLEESLNVFQVIMQMIEASSSNNSGEVNKPFNTKKKPEESNKIYINQNPFCEPQLGKRGLYNTINGKQNELAMLWVLNQSDGTNTLLDIANKSGVFFNTLQQAAKILEEHNLLKEL